MKTSVQELLDNLLKDCKGKKLVCWESEKSWQRYRSTQSYDNKYKVVEREILEYYIEEGGLDRNDRFEVVFNIKTSNSTDTVHYGIEDIIEIID